MNTYTVYFEIYGKKMKAKVKAASPYEAQVKIKDKVVFHKVKKDDMVQPDGIPDALWDIFK